MSAAMLETLVWTGALIAFVLLARRPVARDTALPLGTLMALAGWMIFLVNGWG